MVGYAVGIDHVSNIFIILKHAYFKGEQDRLYYINGNWEEKE